MEIIFRFRVTCSTEIDFTIMFLILAVNKKKASEKQTIYNGLIILNTQTLRDYNTCESSSISDAVFGKCTGNLTFQSASDWMIQFFAKSNFLLSLYVYLFSKNINCKILFLQPKKTPQNQTNKKKTNKKQTKSKTKKQLLGYLNGYRLSMDKKVEVWGTPDRQTQGLHSCSPHMWNTPHVSLSLSLSTSVCLLYFITPWHTKCFI